jgi:hypothetical protein
VAFADHRRLVTGLDYPLLAHLQPCRLAGVDLNFDGTSPGRVILLWVFAFTGWPNAPPLSRRAEP